MSQDSFHIAHLAELERLATAAAGDPVMGPQAEQRLRRAREASRVQQNAPSTAVPRAAFFFQGDGVRGTEGINSLLAGQALTQSARMFAEEAMAAERSAMIAQGKSRRPKGAVMPELMFTGTPRGSFGFSFEPKTTDTDLIAVHSTAIDNVVRAIVGVAGESQSNDGEFVVSNSVLPYLKQFFRAMAAHRVSVRLVTTSGIRHAISRERISTTAERLEREVDEEQMEVEGTVRGLTFESRHFDFKTNAGEIFTGTVNDDLTDRDLERIASLTNRPCSAWILMTTVSHPGRAISTSYTLMDAYPADEYDVTDDSPRTTPTA